MSFSFGFGDWSAVQGRVVIATATLVATSDRTQVCVLAGDKRRVRCAIAATATAAIAERWWGSTVETLLQAP
eukprot:2716670-Amphidinium_carterae.1